MYILVTYDIATTDPKGATRLRRVAKHCQNCGQRVQNSVFECKINSAELAQLKENLLNCIDEKKDSLRITIWAVRNALRLNITGPRHLSIWRKWLSFDRSANPKRTEIITFAKCTRSLLERGEMKRDREMSAGNEN